MNTPTEENIEIQYVLTDDIYGRDEWGNKKLICYKDATIYGIQKGEYIVAKNLYIPKNIVKKPNLKCEGWGYPCDRNDAWKGHMNTQYEHEESNYAILCPECWKECNEHWEGMWADYYNNCM